MGFLMARIPLAVHTCTWRELFHFNMMRCEDTKLSSTFYYHFEIRRDVSYLICENIIPCAICCTRR